MLHRIESSKVLFSQYLSSTGHLSLTQGELSKYGINQERLFEFYQAMMLARLFDNKAVSLQRTGRLGTYPCCLGQEGIGAGIGMAMKQEDVFVQSYRETTTLFCRGVDPLDILLYWGGDERGMDFKKPVEDMPIAVPIASQCCHAVGIAYAMKLRAQPRVTVVIIGDGGTSKGDFYESLNAAGIWQLPLVFIICNNQWALSIPRQYQSASKTLAQKAIAAEIPCQQIDGNDVIGSYIGVKSVIEQARQGKGPFLIEALTYRLSDHTTADDASRYREDQEVTAAWEKEPIKRFKHYLISEFDCQSRLDEIENKLHESINSTVERYLDTEKQSPESMFAHLYEELPLSLQDQLQALSNQTRNMKP